MVEPELDFCITLKSQMFLESFPNPKIVITLMPVVLHIGALEKYLKVNVVQVLSASSS